MYRALARQTHNFCLHLWKLDKEKTLLFTSLKVFVVSTQQKCGGSSRIKTHRLSCKNIKIHLVVFENELIEDAMLVRKNSQN